MRMATMRMRQWGWQQQGWDNKDGNNEDGNNEDRTTRMAMRTRMEDWGNNGDGNDEDRGNNKDGNHDKDRVYDENGMDHDGTTMRAGTMRTLKPGTTTRTGCRGWEWDSDHKDND
jgi:hypothetical protein